MAGFEGTSVGGAQLRLQGSHQTSRIIPSRYFPFSPAPRPAVARGTASDLRSRPPDKPRTTVPEPLSRPAPRPTNLAPQSKQSNGTKDREPVNAEAAVRKVPKEETSQHIVSPISPTNAKRLKKAKSSKHKRSLLQSAEPFDGSPSTTLAASSSCRYDSSLGLLTKKFISKLQEAKDGTLDLNKAAESLEVQKRRIYDITNVLEGVGLIEKKLKNMICWKGIDMSRPREQEDQIVALKADCEKLYAENCKLDGMISDMEENLRAFSEDDNNRKWLFLTKEDINSIPSFKDATLIAIKAPHGTSLEVPDPDEGVDFPQRRYQILLRSAMGPIDCYLISNHEEASNHGQKPTEMDLSVENSCSNDCDTRSLHPGEEGEKGVANEQGHVQTSDRISPVSFVPQRPVDGIVKIVPSDADMDADYWLVSDVGASVTDTWGT